MRPQPLLILCFLITVTACTKKPAQLDVRPIEVASQTEQLSINIVRSLFSSQDVALNEKCERLNGHIEGFVTGLQNDIKVQGDNDGNSDRPDPRNELYIRDKVYYADENYISVCLFIYTFTGGAHGTNDLHSFNFDLRTEELLGPEEIIDNGKEVIVNGMLKESFDNPGDCFTKTPSLSEARGINFSPEVFVFSYRPYTLGPGSCGVATVEIPRAKIKEAVKIKM